MILFEKYLRWSWRIAKYKYEEFFELFDSINYENLKVEEIESIYFGYWYNNIYLSQIKRNTK